MKAKSDIKPTKFKIEKIGSEAIVHFFEDVEEIETEDGTEYEYNYFELRVPFEEDLNQEIEDNYSEWLTLAKKKSNKPNQITELERIESLEEVVNALLGL